MKEELRKKRKRRRILKRILQFSLLGLLLASLAAAVYVAVAATRLMQVRAEQAARASSIAASRSADAASFSADAATASTEPGESDQEATTEVPTETESESEEETSGFSIIDLFDPDLFKSSEEEQGETDYAELVQEYASEKRIWMGDSRFVAMSKGAYLQPNDVFIAKGAQAYDWFSTEGLSQLMQELSKDPRRIVIINFGLNDCANNSAGWDAYFVEDYVDTINRLTTLYPETRFFFASVGLINGDYNRGAGRGKLPMNQVCLYVDEFNNTMYTDCLAEYIDLSEYLVRDGYSTIDGVHFDSATSQKIYNYCVAKAGRYQK
ncbi:MAG: SGNH/GDSL hydrolase family protein [Lachnospiraceae bacterium]|nr:SGNH/GDSL hydrolase family protein [Lachnospiraceae bacterium]